MGEKDGSGAAELRGREGQMLYHTESQSDMYTKCGRTAHIVAVVIGQGRFQWRGNRALQCAHHVDDAKARVPPFFPRLGRGRLLVTTGPLLKCE